MNPKAEYLASLPAFGTPALAALSLGLCLTVFAVALVLMYLKSPASLQRQAQLPLDLPQTESERD